VSSPFEQTGRVYCIAFLPKLYGMEIVSGSFDKTIRVWNVAQAGEHVLGHFEGHDDGSL
jgi:WD40 repeat protein